MSIETLTVELVEKELVQVELAVIDILRGRQLLAELDDVTISSPQDEEVLTYDDGQWKNLPVTGGVDTDRFIYNEVPSQITSKRYQTSNTIVSGTLQVFLNGIKEKEIVIISSTLFEFKIDTLVDDTIEVAYIKQ